mgnify:CR=1 FL=1
MSKEHPERGIMCDSNLASHMVRLRVFRYACLSKEKNKMRCKIGEMERTASVELVALSLETAEVLSAVVHLNPQTINLVLVVGGDALNRNRVHGEDGTLFLSQIMLQGATVIDAKGEAERVCKGGRKEGEQV